MQNLKLRNEFLGEQMPGTAISLRTPSRSGAAERSADEILSITYPTADVQTALKAISTQAAGRPIVLMGDRGRGKSHIMAVMHHAIASPQAVEAWAHEWGNKLNVQSLRDLQLVKGFYPISEPVHNHEYQLLWDLLFERHPKGQFYKGQFAASGQPYPKASLLKDMFTDQPIALILDEFQKWFDGLHDDPGPTGRKWRECASNFIQNLSEIAKDSPNILILVVSVLNNTTDAFQQIHRQGPLLVNFHGPTARQDRKNLMLHRLFENREQIPVGDIRATTDAYSGERFRLLNSHLSGAEQQRIRDEVVGCWPFSPELIDLLENHILMATAAQETRDLIRVLAQVYRARGEQTPLITPADFFVDDDSCGVQSLLDSITTVGAQEKLREIAQRNLANIRAVSVNVPHAREMISALWMRSMSPGRQTGGTRPELHLDITRAAVVDDNAFQAELVALVENSINIHGAETGDGRLRFELDENPRSRIRATAKNDKLWQVGGMPPASGQPTYPGADIRHIRETLTHILVPETRQPKSRVIVLGPQWQQAPWSEVEEGDQPSQWSQPVLLVLPSPIQPADVNSVLGPWLAAHVPKRRNTVRFLLPTPSVPGLFEDAALVFDARCSFLTSRKDGAWGGDGTYNALHKEFDKPLRDTLRSRFDRFAVLKLWNYTKPDECEFEVEKTAAQGGEIPVTVESKVLADMFDPTEFRDLLIERAREGYTFGDLLDEIVEPPAPGTKEAIPFLGDMETLDRVVEAAARGDIILNVSGMWVFRKPEHTSEAEALQYIRPKAFTGNIRQMTLALPGAAGGTTVTGQPGATGTGVTPPGGTGPAPGGTTPPGGTTQPGGTRTTLPFAPLPRTQKSEAPSTGINLQGCFEKWGISPDTVLTTARIEFKDMTAQQVKQVLQRLPSAFKASLEVTFPEQEKKL
jgi:hypothetical protein